MKCIWSEAWVGRCKNEAIEGTIVCEKHTGRKCSSCGAPATHNCDETGQFVCGFDLCDDCEHATFSDGTNGGIGFNAQQPPEGLKIHVKKTEQQYTPWYERESKK